MGLDSWDLLILRLDQRKDNLLSEPITEKERRAAPLSLWMLSVNLQSVRTALFVPQSLSLTLQSFMPVALRHIFKLQVASLRQSRTRVWITHCWYKVTQIWDQLFLILLQALQLWVRECLTKASFNSEMPLCRFWICLKIHEMCTYLHGGLLWRCARYTPYINAVPRSTYWQESRISGAFWELTFSCFSILCWDRSYLHVYQSYQSVCVKCSAIRFRAFYRSVRSDKQKSMASRSF